MQITGIEIEAEPDGLLLVDQFEYVVQGLAITHRVVIANFTNSVFLISPADGVWLCNALFGAVVHNHTNLFVYFFTHSCTESCAESVKTKWSTPSVASKVS